MPWLHEERGPTGLELFALLMLTMIAAKAVL